MKKFLTSSIIILLIVFLAACSSAQVTAIPLTKVTVTFTLPPPSFTPIPTQIVIVPANIPPDYLVGNSGKAFIPPESTPYLPKDYILAVQSLDNYAIVPVIGSDGAYGYAGLNGKNYTAPLEVITDPTTGKDLLLIGTVNSHGIAHYQSADGMIDRWGIMSVYCFGGLVCVQAVSYNQEDTGRAFWLSINPSTGIIDGYLPIFYDTEPRWREDGHWVLDGKINWFRPVGEKWKNPMTGELALWKMEGAMGLSYDSESGENIFIFLADDGIQQAKDDQIFWQADFGGYVANEEGIFVWDGQNSEWIKSEQVVDAAIADGAEIFLAGARRFVRMDGKMHVVTSIENDGGITKISIATEIDRKFVWTTEHEWTRWYAAKIIKEIPLCESMYDVLTPLNKLNPEHMIDSADLQAVANWVQTQLTEDMFDPAKLKLLSDVGMDAISTFYGTILIPDVDTVPNYRDREASNRPFIKDNAWCGSTMIDGKPHLVIQVPYYVEDTPASEWPVIIGVDPLRDDRRGAWPIAIEYYLEDMNVVPWYLHEESIKLAMQYPDPLTGKNFTRERVLEIFKEMKTGNFANAHGLVLQFQIGRSSGGWYE